MTRTVRLALCALALAAPGLVACSSGGDDAGVATTTSTTAPSTTDAPTTTAADDTTTTSEPDDSTDPEAQARAEAALLTIDDFTDPGWEATPRTTTDSLMDLCAGDLLKDRVLARATSDDFDLHEGGGTLSVTSGTGVLRSAPAARALVDAVSRPAFAACAAKAFRERVGDLQVAGEFQPTDPLPDLGDQAVGLGADLTLTDPSSGETHRISVLTVIIRTGDVVSSVTMTGSDHPLDEPTLYPLLDLVVERQA